MRKITQIDVNEAARIVLTPESCAVLSKLHHGTVYKPGDTYQASLWQIMKTFGAHMECGQEMFKRGKVEFDDGG